MPPLTRNALRSLLRALVLVVVALLTGNGFVLAAAHLHESLVDERGDLLRRARQRRPFGHTLQHCRLALDLMQHAEVPVDGR